MQYRLSVIYTDRAKNFLIWFVVLIVDETNRIFNTSHIFKWFTIQYSNSFHRGSFETIYASSDFLKSFKRHDDDDDDDDNVLYADKIRYLKNISQLSITCFLATSSKLARRLITYQRSVPLEINKFRTYYLNRLVTKKKKKGRKAAKSNQYLFRIWSSILIGPVNLAISTLSSGPTLPRPKEAKRGEKGEIH